MDRYNAPWNRRGKRVSLSPTIVTQHIPRFEFKDRLSADDGVGEVTGLGGMGGAEVAVGVGDVGFDELVDVLAGSGGRSLASFDMPLSLLMASPMACRRSAENCSWGGPKAEQSRKLACKSKQQDNRVF